MPLGVIGIIYEARPNVTVDAAGLCIKSGNATTCGAVLKPFTAIRFLPVWSGKGLAKAGLPEQAVQVVETTDRTAVGELITMTEYVDVIVPRGGKGLIERLMRESKIPMIKHLDGICHIYIDDSADLDKAVEIGFNAKCQRYGTCNTMETLLVSENVAADVLPLLATRYRDEEVELRCDEKAFQILGAYPYLCQSIGRGLANGISRPDTAVRVVSGLDEAIAHINRYSSKHTDAIITEDYSHSLRFLLRGGFVFRHDQCIHTLCRRF